MRQDVLYLAMWVSRSFEVINLHVLGLLLLVNAEVEVLLRDHLVVLAGSELLGCELVFKLELLNLFLDDSINSFFDRLKVMR